MVFGAARVLWGFDAGAVSGARVAVGLRRIEVQAWARAALPSGALEPRPVDANVVEGDVVQQALRQVAAALDVAPQARVRLVLPDGVARLALLEQPRGVDAVEFARFRLAPGLPYAADEAVVGLLPAGRGQVLAAVLRRGTAAEYEAVVRAAGFVPEGVFLAPVATLAELLRRPPAEDAVAVALGDQALLLAAFRAGRLRVVRNRRRDGAADEAAWVSDEVARTATAAEMRDAPRVLLLGPGSRGLGHALGLAGHVVEVRGAEAARVPAEAAECAWLGAAA